MSNIKSIRSAVNELFLDNSFELRFMNNAQILNYIKHAKEELREILKINNDLNVFQRLEEFLRTQWLMISRGEFTYHLIPAEPLSLCLYQIARILSRVHNAKVAASENKITLSYIVLDPVLIAALKKVDKRFTHLLPTEKLMCSHWYVIEFLKYFCIKREINKNMMDIIKPEELACVFESAVSQREWAVASFMLKKTGDKMIYKDVFSFVFEYASALHQWSFLKEVLSVTDDSVLSADFVVSRACESAADEGQWDFVQYLLAINDRRKPDEFAVTFVLRRASWANQKEVCRQILSPVSTYRPLVSQVKKLLKDIRASDNHSTNYREICTLLSENIRRREKSFFKHHVDVNQFLCGDNLASSQTGVY